MPVAGSHFGQHVAAEKVSQSMPDGQSALLKHMLPSFAVAGSIARSTFATPDRRPVGEHMKTASFAGTGAGLLPALPLVGTLLLLLLLLVPSTRQFE
jgi:hypothetical protein